MKIPLLDEQDWNVPQALADLPEQNIDKANNFMWYFHSSQFMEPACNNTAILNAHVNDPGTYEKIHDRKEFDRLLHTIPEGLQFVVSREPQTEGQPWLYQRQNMVRNQENKVDTIVEGNWYNRGTQVLMAPSLLDVVRARLVSSCRHRSCRTCGAELTAYAAHCVDASPTGGRTVPQHDPLEPRHWTLLLSRVVRCAKSSCGESHGQSDACAHSTRSVRRRCNGTGSRAGRIDNRVLRRAFYAVTHVDESIWRRVHGRESTERRTRRIRLYQHKECRR